MIRYTTSEFLRTLLPMYTPEEIEARVALNKLAAKWRRQNTARAIAKKYGADFDDVTVVHQR